MSLQEKWTGEELTLVEHRSYLEAGIQALRERLVLPGDGRFEITYALLSSGLGNRAIALAAGDPGTAKTEFGDTVLGIENRTEADRDDDEASLYGYISPIDPDKFIPPKIKGLNEYNPAVYINELGNLRNQRNILRLGDTDALRLGDGTVVPLADTPIYFTTNFPDGRTVHELEPALSSRTAIKMLTGDYDEKTKQEIQNLGLQRVGGVETSSPLVPSLDARVALRGLLLNQYHFDSKMNGTFITSFLNKLERGGIVASTASGTDARISQKLHAASTAQLFYKGQITDPDKESEVTAINVGPLQIARVSALAIPSITRLTNVAERDLAEIVGRRLNNTEKAVVLRRAIAQAAIATAFDIDINLADHFKLSDHERLVNDSTYANIEAVPFDVDRALSVVSERQQKGIQDNSDKTGLSVKRRQGRRRRG